MPLLETIGSSSIKGYGFGSGVQSRLPIFQSSNLMFFTDPLFNDPNCPNPLEAEEPIVSISGI